MNHTYKKAPIPIIQRQQYCWGWEDRSTLLQYIMMGMVSDLVRLKLEFGKLFHEFLTPVPGNADIGAIIHDNISSFTSHILLNVIQIYEK